MKNDHWLKRIWFINGVLLLLAFIIVIFISTMELYRTFNRSNNDRGIIVGEQKEEADEEKIELQNVTTSTPRKIYNSNFYYMMVYQRDYETPRKIAAMEVPLSSSYSDYNNSMGVNLIFLNTKTNETKLLLDKKASINKMDYPSYEADSLQRHIYYEISFEDTDKNGRINSSDKNQYLISALDGSSLKSIIPPDFKVIEYEFTTDYKEIYFICKKINTDKNVHEEHWEQLFLTYNINNDELNINELINQRVSKARDILLN